MDSEKSITSDGIVLFRGFHESVIVPQKPSIPLKEGIHAVVTGEHDSADSPKGILRRMLVGLGVAKAVAEGAHTRDAWANTRIEAGNRVSVYGRVFEEPDSWRKPVNSHGDNDALKTENYYGIEVLRDLFGRYLPKWEKEISRMNLFSDGVSGKDIEVDPEKGGVVWENEKFNLYLVRTPHLNGIHLVVNPKESYWGEKGTFARQWQTDIKTADNEYTKYIQGTLEATAIALAARELLAPGRGEIHNSGNWASGLREEGDVLSGGKFSDVRFKEHRKKEKRLHRPDIVALEKKVNTEMHVHVYIPDKEGDPVILPEMSKEEAIARKGNAVEKGISVEGFDRIISSWEKIKPLDPEKIKEVASKLGDGKLNILLQEKYSGNL